MKNQETDVRAEYLTFITNHLNESARIKNLVAESCAAEINLAAKAIASSFATGGKLLICGNGGSAADSQHMAAEFVSTLTLQNKRRALPALALTTDTSFLTANTNDFGFNDVFARQVEALGTSEDVLIGISTSGNSTNVIHAIRQSIERNMTTVVLTGESGGAMADLCHIAIRVPSRDTQHIQESHIAIIHTIVALVERRMFAA